MDDINSLEFHNVGLAPHNAPFNHTKWPSYITADARVVTSGWDIVKNSASKCKISPFFLELIDLITRNRKDAPPASPACGAGARSTCSSSKTKIKLVPHGGTDLRIGEFPVA